MEIDVSVDQKPTTGTNGIPSVDGGMGVAVAWSVGVGTGDGGAGSGGGDDV
jgi:hypothetical protein